VKALKSIFSALLALLVLVSATSFTIDKHLCMGRVQSVAILHDAAPCPMELMAEAGMGMDGCCQDTQTKIQGNDLQLKTLKPVAIEYQSLWVATLEHVIETFDLKSASTYISHPLYKPPLIDQDVPVLIQSFLI